VLGLAAVVFCVCRFRKGTPFALGFFLATKQYLLFIPALTVLLEAKPLRWRPWLKGLGLALAVAAVVTVPFALWNLGAFLNDVVLLQLKQPLRMDALSYVAWAARQGVLMPQGIAFLLAAGATALAIWRCPRTPSGFALGVTLVFLTFFAFNKQAFCNYYYFVLGALACALAVRGGTGRPTERG
jgi:hypothetical protein